METHEATTLSAGTPVDRNMQGQTILDGAAGTTSARLAVLFHASIAGDGPVAVTTFDSEAEARCVFARLCSLDARRSAWVEIASVGGGRRPAILAWSGRPFPPITEETLLAWPGPGHAVKAG